jgi:hypothetical protein
MSESPQWRAPSLEDTVIAPVVQQEMDGNYTVKRWPECVTISFPKKKRETAKDLLIHESLEFQSEYIEGQRIFFTYLYDPLKLNLEEIENFVNQFVGAQIADYTLVWTWAELFEFFGKDTTKFKAEVFTLFDTFVNLSLNNLKELVDWYEKETTYSAPSPEPHQYSPNARNATHNDAVLRIVKKDKNMDYRRKLCILLDVLALKASDSEAQKRAERVASIELKTCANATYGPETAFVMYASATRADVLFKVAEASYLQLRLKTATKAKNLNGYKFRNVLGYAGMLVVCWAVDLKKAWVFDGTWLDERKQRDLNFAPGSETHALKDAKALTMDQLIAYLHDHTHAKHLRLTTEDAALNEAQASESRERALASEREARKKVYPHVCSLFNDVLFVKQQGTDFVTAAHEYCEKSGKLKDFIEMVRAVKIIFDKCTDAEGTDIDMIKETHLKERDLGVNFFLRLGNYMDVVGSELRLRYDVSSNPQLLELREWFPLHFLAKNERDFVLYASPEYIGGIALAKLTLDLRQKSATLSFKIEHQSIQEGIKEHIKLGLNIFPRIRNRYSDKNPLEYLFDFQIKKEHDGDPVKALTNNQSEVPLFGQEVKLTVTALSKVTFHYALAFEDFLEQTPAPQQEITYEMGNLKPVTLFPGFEKLAAMQQTALNKVESVNKELRDLKGLRSDGRITEEHYAAEVNRLSRAHAAAEDALEAAGPSSR